jgi:hypothetical protein
MSRSLKLTAFVLLIAAMIFVFGSKDGARAQAVDVYGSSAAKPIYPTGGSDGPS